VHKDINNKMTMRLIFWYLLGIYCLL